MKLIKRFLLETEAATAVEYAVMLALILGVAIVGIGTVGGGSSDLWDNNSNQITNAMNNGSS